MTLQSRSSFQATLAEPLNFGHILEICGKAQQDANSITVNFRKTKATSNGIDIDNDLQIVLDFKAKQIRFLLVHKGDSINNGIYPKKLILAEFLNEFKFYIMLAESKFHIALNNKPLISFKYNRDLAKLQIQAIEILGKLEYLKQLDHRKYFPHIWPPIQIIDDYIDFSNDQPMSFKPDHIIIIKARLEGNSKGRFIIQFCHARDNRRQELHVSVRFDAQKIIRNSKYRQSDSNLAFDDKEVDGFTFLFSSFGQEETDDTATVFPFKDFNKPFKLAVALCETQFLFAKDGKFLFNFCYRSPNVLPHIMGPKIFGTHGVNVRVSGIEHFPENCEIWRDFEKYSL